MQKRATGRVAWVNNLKERVKHGKQMVTVTCQHKS
jgi:hypothetical protein